MLVLIAVVLDGLFLPYHDFDCRKREGRLPTNGDIS